MDLKQLSYIVAIADEKNLTKAAEKLYISQPALSLCLSRLEDSLGLKLFERQKSAMVPTQAGELYVNTAREMLAMKDDLYQKLDKLAKKKASVLEIGIVPLTCGPMFTTVYPNYKKLEPDVSIQVTESPSHALEQLLLEQKIRLAFLTCLPSTIESGLTFQLLRNENFFIGISKNNPLTAELEKQLSDKPHNIKTSSTITGSIAIDSFRSLPFILSPSGTNRRLLEDKTFQEVGFTPEVSCEINNMSTIYRMVAANNGVAFFAEGFTHDDGPVRFFAIDTKPSWNIAVAYLRSIKLTPHEKRFIDLAKEYFKTHRSYL